MSGTIRATVLPVAGVMVMSVQPANTLSLRLAYWITSPRIRTWPVAGNLEASSSVIVPLSTSAETTLARNHLSNAFTSAGSNVSPTNENRSALNVNLSPTRKSVVPL